MAFVATCFSLGAYFSGNNSVFSLVVLAVYGLGGMFIPLILVRMSGYKPSSQHSMLMMTAALVAVIFWRVKGYNVHIFESVPGMGAAFIVHFILVLNENKDHWLEKLPEKSVTASFIVGILVLIIPVEYYYANNAPTSMASSSPDPDSMWNLTVEYDWTEIDETILISDGATESFYFDVPSDVIVMLFFLNYSESNEVGVVTVCDDIETSHDISELSPEFNSGPGISDLSGKFCGTEDLGFLSTVPNFAQNDTYENHIKTIERLQVEKQDSSLAINVKIDVDRGTPLNVDGGEEVYIGVVQFRYISHTLTQIE